jgi:hypothetical protein
MIIFFKSLILFILLVGMWLGFKFLFVSLRSIESPHYQVIEKYKNIELRKYPAIILASVDLSGKQLQVLPVGFKKIADYIFGNNNKAQRIAMTAPVLEIGSNDSWQVAFIMPAKFTMHDLPKPIHSEIKTSKRPGSQYIVLRFSGSIKYKNLSYKLKEFNDYLQKNNCTTFGEPVFAFYNPPWTLPFLRRNEIWYQIKQSCIKNDKDVDD